MSEPKKILTFEQNKAIVQKQNQSFLSAFSTLIDTCQSEIDQMAPKIYPKSITLDLWKETTGAYGFYADLAITGCTEDLLPEVIILKDSLANAQDIAQTCQSLEGAVRVWASKKPKSQIDVVVKLTKGKGD